MVFSAMSKYSQSPLNCFVHHVSYTNYFSQHCELHKHFQSSHTHCYSQSTLLFLLTHEAKKTVFTCKPLEPVEPLEPPESVELPEPAKPLEPVEPPEPLEPMEP